MNMDRVKKNCRNYGVQVPRIGSFDWWLDRDGDEFQAKERARVTG